jgi:hypothetical protein
MYTGRMMGGQLPIFGLGESPIYNLAGSDEALGEVSESGYGPYLGNIFDDISRVASQVGVASGELAQVASGKKTIGTFRPDQPTLMIPGATGPVAVAIPVVPILIGAGVLLFLVMRRR